MKLNRRCTLYPAGTLHIKQIGIWRKQIVAEWNTGKDKEGIERERVAVARYALSQYRDHNIGIIEIKGELVGIMSFTKKFHLCNLASKRSGYGSVLLEALLRNAEASGGEVTLFSYITTVPFYKKHGFAVSDKKHSKEWLQYMERKDRK